MQDPMFSVETIDAAIDYQQEYNKAMQDDSADYYIDELDKANKKIDELYMFIETIEALTSDKATAVRIRDFMVQQGMWNAKPVTK